MDSKVYPLDKKTTINPPRKKVVNEVRGREASERQVEALRSLKEGKKNVSTGTETSEV